MTELYCASDFAPHLHEFADAFGLGVSTANMPQNTEYHLHHDGHALALVRGDSPKTRVVVDFCAGATAHRRKFGGGKGQDIAKAVGVSAAYIPTVVDATAGLGRDSFVLATLGCDVTAIERQPVVAALLQDGLGRARLDHEVGNHPVEHRAFEEAVVGVLKEVLHRDRRLILEELDRQAPQARLHHDDRVLGRGGTGSEGHSGYNSNDYDPKRHGICSLRSRAPAFALDPKTRISRSNNPNLWNVRCDIWVTKGRTRVISAHRVAAKIGPEYA